MTKAGTKPGVVALALAVGAGLLWFYLALSQQDTAKTIRVGDTIPHFTAIDGRGESFDSASLQGQLVLIKFFRGHW